MLELIQAFKDLLIDRNLSDSSYTAADRSSDDVDIDDNQTTSLHENEDLMEELSNMVQRESKTIHYKSRPDLEDMVIEGCSDF